MDTPQEIIKDFLESRDSFIQKGLRRESGFRMTNRYTDLMDRFVRSLFFEAGFRETMTGDQKDCLAVVALGSYGRRELCLASDVDLMVIHQGRLSLEMSDTITRGLHSLWDAKLDIGHTILTVQECIRLSLNDFRVLTSVIDARFLFGSRAFYRLFNVAFWSRIYRETGPLLNQFVIYQKRREEKYGSENYLLEPDIKEGLGGLRDLHFMAWKARIYFKCTRLSQIRQFTVFSHFELDKLSYSKGFLLKVRNHLHHLSGRKDDRLLISYQKELSHILGYQDSPHITGPEKFLKDLYLHLNRIRYGHEEFQAKALDIINPQSLETSPLQVPQEFRVTKGNITLREEGLLKKTPLLLIMALHEANQRDLFLGSGFIWQAKKMISREGKALIVLPEAKRLFLEMIIKPKNPKIIRLALEIGLIGIFIPEFKKIRNLAQFGFYHVKTVDLHSLNTMDVINEISRGAYDARWPLFRGIFSELKHADWLFLSCFFHDIGKGYPGDHPIKGAELVKVILRRLGISGEAIEVISFLVKHHLLLVRISQGRDLNEEKTSVNVAQIIRDKDLLRMLFLLTIADSLATGPMARSDWKIMLLTELFFKVRHILEGGRLATPDATNKIDAKKRMALNILGNDFPKKDVLYIMDQVSSRYFLNTSQEIIALHFRMALTLGEKSHSWTLQKLKDVSVTRVIQCMHDRPGLFSKMVGVFNLNNIKVFSANIFTLKNGLAFNIYEVTNPLDPYRERERWEEIHRQILLAMEDQLPLDELIKKKGETMLAPEKHWGSKVRNVRINNEFSDFFTVIEVSSDERFELLYNLTKEVFSLGLDIRFAKINRDKEKMKGSFYVRDTDGQKIYREDQIRKIERMIWSALE